MFDSIPVTDERARMLAIAVRQLDLEYRALRTRVVERAGVSVAELDVLIAVADSPQITPKGLALAANLTTSAMTALLDRLSASGLLHRMPHPKDRRSVILKLTPVGFDLVSDLFHGYVAKFEALLARESCLDGRIEDLVGVLGCLSGALASPAAEAEHALTA